MYAQRASPALREHRQIAARLRRFDDSKCIFLVGHAKIDSVIAGDLQKDSAVGSALVGLSRRVLEPRPKPKRGGDLFGVTDRETDALQRRFILRVHLDIRQQREIIARSGAADMSL